MKRLFLALALSALVVSPAFAKEFFVTGCTSDGQRVDLTIDVNDAIEHPSVAHIRVAFDKAARSMTAPLFLSMDGFNAFAANLDDTDKEAIVAIVGNPRVTGTCPKAE